MKKINKMNVLVLLMFIASAGMVLFDVLRVFLATFRGEMISWTIWGGLTLTGTVLVAGISFDYMADYFEK